MEKLELSCTVGGSVSFLSKKEPELDGSENSQPIPIAKTEKAWSENYRCDEKNHLMRLVWVWSHRNRNNIVWTEGDRNGRKWRKDVRLHRTTIELFGSRCAILQDKEEGPQRWFRDHQGCLLSFKGKGVGGAPLVSSGQMEPCGWGCPEPWECDSHLADPWYDLHLTELQRQDCHPSGSRRWDIEPKKID